MFEKSKGIPDFECALIKIADAKECFFDLRMQRNHLEFKTGLDCHGNRSEWLYRHRNPFGNRNSCIRLIREGARCVREQRGYWIGE